LGGARIELFRNNVVVTREFDRSGLVMQTDVVKVTAARLRSASI